MANKNKKKLTEEKKERLAWIKKFYIVWIVVAALIFAGGMEVKSNLPVLRQDANNRGEFAYDLTKCEATGMHLENGAWVQDADNPTLTIPCDGSYICKFKYTYEADKSVEATIQVGTDGCKLDDNNNQFTDTSVSRIYNNPDQLTISFSKAENLVVTGASKLNVAVFNYRRFITFLMIAFVMLFVLTAKSWAKDHPERIFLVAAGCLGFAYLFLLPAQKVGWDECYHFRQAYQMTAHKNVSEIPKIYGDDTKVWPLNYPVTFEEYGAQNAYINSHMSGDYENPAKISLTGLVGYAAPAFGLFLGKIFHMPFTDAYVLGRAFAMILYIVVTYFAIKRIPVGKRLFSFLGLAPTVLFTAAIYNRDNVIIPFAFLAISYLLAEFYETEETITWKNYIIIMFSLFVVILMKAVYAPLVFMILLLPKEKFSDKKTRFLMQGGILIVGVALACVIFLPRLIHPSMSGDSRGLDGESADAVISAGGQISYILHNPLAYTRTLLSNMKASLVDFTVGTGVLTTMGHYEGCNMADLLPPILVFVLLTDTNVKYEDISIGKKLWIFFFVFACACLVWTSLYISFTPVGYGTIKGVQPRYYMPFLPLFLMLFNTKKLPNRLDPSRYTRFVFFMPVLVNALFLYINLLRPYCS